MDSLLVLLDGYTSGSIQGKWAALGTGGKTAFVTVTCILFIGLVRLSNEHRADTSHASNRLSKATSTPILGFDIHCRKWLWEEQKPANDIAGASMADGPVPLKRPSTISFG